MMALQPLTRLERRPLPVATRRSLPVRTRGPQVAVPSHRIFGSPPRAAPLPSSSGWILGYVLFQFVCQIALLIPQLGAMRVLVRSAAFGASLLLLLVLRGRGRRHPACGPALWVLGIMGLSLFHPTGNTLLAGMAQFAMYLAILAPLFWVPGVSLSPVGFRRIILIFWAFHTLSAGVGVLQVYFPGEFQPAISTVVESRGIDYVDSLKIMLPDGQMVFRPMGLTDQPGGAAMAGLYAVLFGLGLLLVERKILLQAAAISGMAVGLFCLYLCQVRSVLVMAGICIVTLCLMLLRRGEFARFCRILTLLSIVIGGSFVWAVSLGGAAVTDRLATLIDERADDVYYANRGYFLDETIHYYLPLYPMGAGLGRWGMMNTYFGDNSDPHTSSIWVEIQWTGWLLDGGVPLVLAYVAALLAAFWAAWKIASDRYAGQIGLWGALILAYNVSAVAVTFNYPLFIGEGGLEFWLLNACLFAAYTSQHRVAKRIPKRVTIGPVPLRQMKGPSARPLPETAPV